MPSSLLARDITKSFGPRVVLDGVSCTVGPTHRIGVVAPNGTGKSTLLKILAGIETPDAGTVTRTPPTSTVGYLPQEPERRAGETVRAYLARRTGAAAAEADLDAASGALASGRPGADDAYAAALDRYLALGAADLDARIAAVCDDLGLTARLLDVEMRALSGGEASRASLAAILLSRFDVFLLDEPTNDLDFAGLERLEGFLRDELTQRRRDRVPRPGVPGSHDHERARARRPHAHRIGVCGWLGRRISTSAPRRAVMRSRPTRSTAPSGASWSTVPGASDSGLCRARRR